MKRTGTKRILLASGALLGIGALFTAAAYNDTANLNLGSGTSSSGIGYPNRFDIGIVLPDNTVEQADTASGFDWTIAGSDQLVPGSSITTTIPVFNNTPDLRAAVDFKVLLRNTDGSVGPGVPNITRFLRFTASRNGTALFSDVTWNAASGTLGTLAARGSTALAEGAVYTNGAAGSSTPLILKISYLDVPGVEAYNGGRSALRLRFNASSVH
ncbi:hypothetical protein [Luethyella okanaganae]|uniref:Ribosomally synthesized peptide with SipW-like signal peptide n=1 Tax=Luethyella okanaganae TaxID=69372 RepID=A0ABW1VG38_9MICO